MHISEPRSFGIHQGLPDAQRDFAATLYWQAFRRKLQLPMGPQDRAHAFLRHHMTPEFSIAALDCAGRLIGLAGFKTRDGAFISGGLRDLHEVYGRFGGYWRGMILSVLERELESDVLLMDGICVDEGWRGRGVGSALLSAIKDKALALNCGRVRLDVVDTNPRAKALYLRQGFQVAKVEDIWPLHGIFGFRRSNVMYCDL